MWLLAAFAGYVILSAVLLWLVTLLSNRRH